MIRLLERKEIHICRRKMPTGDIIAYHLSQGICISVIYLKIENATGVYVPNIVSILFIQSQINTMN